MENLHLGNEHIEIVRESTRNTPYAFRSNPYAPRPPLRDRQSHGRALQEALASSVASAMEGRKRAGVDADALLVLELSSGAAGPGIDVLQSKFGVVVVEETRHAGGLKYLVQFASQEDIATFERERYLWQIDYKQESTILTYAQRRDLFACIDTIREVSPEDRTGHRLAVAIASDTLPDKDFCVDIDVWHDGDASKRTWVQGRIREALGTTGSRLLGDLYVLPNLLLGRARVNRFTVQALRELDLIAQVEFPIGPLSAQQCELYDSNFVPAIENDLGDDAPLACVVDSGVFSANPLLSPVIVAEEDFDLTEHTTSDQNGHGTGVAGIVVYGDFDSHDSADRVFRPLVRICSAKVMHNVKTIGGHETGFVETKRPEQIVEEAIRHFHDNHNCRVFNLSCGNQHIVYAGGRQTAWAYLLDQLSRELDIVIIVSSGNVMRPVIPDFSDRNDLMDKIRDQLLDDDHRLIDPATSALSVTVGSITRYGQPGIWSDTLPITLAAGKAGYPSAFTRTGEGVNGAIKPDFADYGGNLGACVNNGRIFDLEKNDFPA